MKFYILNSLSVGITVGLINSLSVLIYFRHVSLLQCLLIFATSFTHLFVFCFISLRLLDTIMKARQRKLQMKYEDDDKG